MTIQWLTPRRINKRIDVIGTLILLTPTSIGNGEVDNLIDIGIFRDPLEGKAILPGSSIAGAMRSYLSTCDKKLVPLLFGDVINDKSYASPLIIDDSLTEVSEIEIRSGISINPKKRTAEDKYLYDTELLPAAIKFNLHFELLVYGDKGKNLCQALAIALSGFETEEIHLGRRKSRGFGRCRVSEWRVTTFDMQNKEDVFNWLTGKGSPKICQVPPVTDDHQFGAPLEKSVIAEILDVKLNQPAGDWCVLKGKFGIADTFLIRTRCTAQGEPDSTHLRSGNKPILSGTSLAGALRARAEKIANTFGKNGSALTDHLFGKKVDLDTEKNKMTASRFYVEETIVNDPLEMVHTRTAIDRFTGGAAQGALFSEQILVERNETEVVIKIRIKKAGNDEVGLLLLLLKDLWTGDLPIGGESSVGRGRLHGKEAELSINGETYKFVADKEPLDLTTPKNHRSKVNLTQGNWEDLQKKYVNAFLEAKYDRVAEEKY